MTSDSIDTFRAANGVILRLGVVLAEIDQIGRPPGEILAITRQQLDHIANLVGEAVRMATEVEESL
jgi:hypothetical protein